MFGVFWSGKSVWLFWPWGHRWCWWEGLKASGLCAGHWQSECISALAGSGTESSRYGRCWVAVSSAICKDRSPSGPVRYSWNAVKELQHNAQYNNVIIYPVFKIQWMVWRTICPSALWARWCAGLRIHIPHIFDAACPQDVIDAYDVLMTEPQEDFDLPQGALAVGLVFKRTDLLNGHSDLIHIIKSWAAGGRERDGGKWGGRIIKKSTHTSLCMYLSRTEKKLHDLVAHLTVNGG